MTNFSGIVYHTTAIVLNLHDKKGVPYLTMDLSKILFEIYECESRGSGREDSNRLLALFGILTDRSYISLAK